MFTELDRSVIIAISSGFIGGLSQSVLDDFFSLKIDKQIKSLEIIIKKSLLSGFGAGIILGVVTFALASWDSTIAVLKSMRYRVVRFEAGGRNKMYLSQLRNAICLLQNLIDLVFSYRLLFH